MKKRLEKSLSILLVLIIMVVFVISTLSRRVDVTNQTLKEVWNILFISSRFLMLIYGIYILFQNDSRGFSIFTAIVTGIAFAALSFHAIIMLSNYLSFIPSRIYVSNKLLVFKGQAVFYTCLIFVYLLHLINLLQLGKGNSDIDNKDSLEIEENDTENIILVNKEK